MFFFIIPFLVIFGFSIFIAIVDGDGAIAGGGFAIALIMALAIGTVGNIATQEHGHEVVNVSTVQLQPLNSGHYAQLTNTSDGVRYNINATVKGQQLFEHVPAHTVQFAPVKSGVYTCTSKHKEASLPWHLFSGWTTEKCTLILPVGSLDTSTAG